MGKMADIPHANLDKNSIWLFGSTLFLKLIAEANMSDYANFFAAVAAITTIVYNVVSFYKKFIKKG